MAVKILIKRKIPANIVDELMPLFQRLRVMAMNQPGYIAGETLKRVDRKDEYLVISTWQAIDNWREWVINKDRAEIQQKIDRLIERDTEYDIYEFA